MNRTIQIDRFIYSGNTAIGRLSFPNEKNFCYTLEDLPTAYGVKSKGYSAIPQNYNDRAYYVDLTLSERFKKVLPIIYTETDKVTLKHAGISFTGIRIHGGAKSEHTDGCIIVGKKIIDNETISEPCTDEIVLKLKELLKYGLVNLVVRNLPNSI